MTREELFSVNGTTEEEYLKKSMAQIKRLLSTKGLTEFEKAVQEASYLEIHPSDEDAIKEQAKHLLELAYKNIPVWRKTIGHGTSIGEINGWPTLFHDGYYVKICELMKLPKEGEK